MLVSVLAVTWMVAIVSAQLDPSESQYCNVNPQDFKIPAISPEGLELRQLQVFIRHGDRTIASAESCWPGDQTTEYACDLAVALASSPGGNGSSSSTWPRDWGPGRVYRKQYLKGQSALPGNCGLGQLTSRGYAQQQANAAVLREAYDAFLPDLNDDEAGDPSDMSGKGASFSLRSTDYDRTIQSGQALVDALFPPPLTTTASSTASTTDASSVQTSQTQPSQTRTSQTLTSQTQQRVWNTVDAGWDPILEPFELCPFASGVFTAILDDPDYQEQYDIKVAPVVTALSQAYGVDSDDDDFDDLSNVALDMDCIYTHACGGYATPGKLNQSLVDQVEAAASWEFGYALGYQNNSGLRANVGLLLRDVVGLINTTLAYNQQKQKQPDAEDAEDQRLNQRSQDEQEEDFFGKDNEQEEGKTGGASAAAAAAAGAAAASASAVSPVLFGLWSGHDTGPMFPMLQALGMALGETSGRWPAYASMLVLEIWGPISATTTSTPTHVPLEAKMPSTTTAASDVEDSFVRFVFEGAAVPIPGCAAAKAATASKAAIEKRKTHTAKPKAAPAVSDYESGGGLNKTLLAKAMARDQQDVADDELCPLTFFLGFAASFAPTPEDCANDGGVAFRRRPGAAGSPATTAQKSSYRTHYRRTRPTASAHPSL